MKGRYQNPFVPKGKGVPITNLRDGESGQTRTGTQGDPGEGSEAMPQGAGRSSHLTSPGGGCGQPSSGCIKGQSHHMATSRQPPGPRSAGGHELLEFLTFPGNGKKHQNRG